MINVDLAMNTDGEVFEGVPRAALRAIRSAPTSRSVGHPGCGGSPGRRPTSFRRRAVGRPRHPPFSRSLGPRGGDPLSSSPFLSFVSCLPLPPSPPHHHLLAILSPPFFASQPSSHWFLLQRLLRRVASGIRFAFPCLRLLRITISSPSCLHLFLLRNLSTCHHSVSQYS